MTGSPELSRYAKMRAFKVKTSYPREGREMTKKQHYMTYQERLKLEAYQKIKMPVAKIAKELGFCKQTIYDELKLGEYMHNVDYDYEKRYSADIAEAKHRVAQTAKGKQLKIGNDIEYANYLESKIINDRYSPAAAIAAAKREGFETTICPTTLYSYIDKGIFLQLTNKDLWEKRKKKKRGYARVKRIAHPNLPSITERAPEILQRSEPGHWEMDLVVGKEGKGPVLLTMTERKTRYELIYKLQDRKSESVKRIFDQLERELPNFKEIFRSITTDNGPEFLKYHQLKESIHGGDRFQIYYCHSYAAWEKGTNENHNRMIRRYFPKGTNFQRVSKARIKEISDWINNYPRKILSWKTPREAMSCPLG